MIPKKESFTSMQEIRTTIIGNIHFRNGVLETPTEEMFMDKHTPKPIIDAGWKGNIHLQIYDIGNRYRYIVLRNGEQVSASYYAGRPDERFFKSIQKLVDAIENGDYDHKKTQSEKIAEIVQKRRLTSYMNQTKWNEFLHANLHDSASRNLKSG